MSALAPHARLYPGDLAPWFRQRSDTPAGAYSFDMAAGRHVLLCFTTPQAQTALAAIHAHRALFDNRTAICFTISTEAAATHIPGTIHIHDHDLAVSQLYGTDLHPLWFVLDPSPQRERAPPPPSPFLRTPRPNPATTPRSPSSPSPPCSNRISVPG